MDTLALHTLTDDLASLLSEVTVSDLDRPVREPFGDLGDLYLHLLRQAVDRAAAVVGAPIPRGTWHDPLDRPALGGSADLSGDCGLDRAYRRTADLLEDAFASAGDGAASSRPGGSTEAVDLAALYDIHACETLVHTWDVAQALGLAYRPAPDAARRALRTIVLAPSHALPTRAATAAAEEDDATFECVLRLSGRRLSASSAGR
ncbi:maleylpyruvate isomerase N-terminal domain-containing protein [Cellulomonas sp. NS3]|uniref:maleylpyruvate isomerase N-terminal domain-containing protein n=1 Tax=Cellulomonas sp. NS3 TaxID=2973977 RepID=UPI002161221A|nr:maleylpyruvate isomerase N-terminal domain-containing protein [Cellulomonas sp. NS3]